MPAPVDLTTAEHYTWGEQCDGWHLVRAEGLSVIQERMPPGTSEQRHRHDRARQFFYVLRGELALECDGAIELLIPGRGLEIPPGIAHRVHNRGPAPAKFLVISQPPSHGDRALVPSGEVG